MDRESLSRTEKVVLSFVLATFLVLGIYYAKGNPLYTKPDEAYHYAYALHLKSGRGLPVIDTARVGPGRHTPVEMEGHQPPLYYATIAAIASLFGFHDTVTPAVNPHFLGTLEGNKNPLTPAYATLSDVPILFTGRFISLLCGTGALLCSYLLCRLFLPWPLAVLSVAFMGFNPQFLFIASSFSNDMMSVAATHAGLWQMGKIIREGLTLRRSVGLGIIIGLSALTKLTGLGLLIPLGIIVLGQAWKSRKGWPVVWASVAGLITLFIDGWWLWRNWTLYGNPFATNLLPVLLGPRTVPWTLNEFRFFINFLWKAYWLDFSPGSILFAESCVYTLIYLICFSAVIGLALVLVHNRLLRSFFLLVWGWFALVLVSLFQLTSKTAIFMGGGRLLFPAAVAISSTLAVGLSRLCRYPVLPAGLAALLGIFAAIAPARYLYPVYPRPTLVKNLESLPSYLLYVRFGNQQFELIGYNLELAEISGQRALRITYYWKTLEKSDHNFSVFIHLETQQGGQPTILAQTDTYPGYGIWPTSAWQSDRIFVDRLALFLPPPGQPFSGVLLTGLYFLPSMERLPAYDRAGHRFPADAVPLAYIWMGESGTLHLAIPYPSGE